MRRPPRRSCRSDGSQCISKLATEPPESRRVGSSRSEEARHGRHRWTWDNHTVAMPVTACAPGRRCSAPWPVGAWQPAHTPAAPKWGGGHRRPLALPSGSPQAGRPTVPTPVASASNTFPRKTVVSYRTYQWRQANFSVTVAVGGEYNQAFGHNRIILALPERIEHAW